MYSSKCSVTVISSQELTFLKSLIVNNFIIDLVEVLERQLAYHSYTRETSEGYLLRY